MKNLKIDTVQYINLDQRSDRRNHIEDLLSPIIDKVHRVPAVRLESRPENLGFRMKSEHAGSVSVASIFISHIKAVEAAIATCGDGAAVIIEDDCHFPPNIWTDDLGISNVPESWRLLMIGQRFRAVGSPSVRPRLSLIQRLNPMRKSYWKHPLKDKQGRFGSDLKGNFIASGAHFLVFRDIGSLKFVLQMMREVEEFYHVDKFYSECVPGSFSLYSSQVYAKGFGSDNKG